MAASPESWSRPADRAGVALAALASAVVFAVAWNLLHVGFWSRDQIVDTPVYEEYGDAIVRGEVPYRDFRPEYPPLALPAFALPALVVGEDARLSEYQRVFDMLMLACGLVAVVLVAAALGVLRAGPARIAAALGLVALSPLLLGSVVLTRFDLWPAALTVGALAALVAGRDRLGAGVLGLAVAAKLYPAVLAPLALAWIWRRRGRREALVAAGIFLAVLAVAFLPFAILAPDGLAASLSRQLSRPLQLESLGAALLVVLHGVAGLDVEMVGSHGSQNVAGLLGDAVGWAQTALGLAVLVWLWVAFARGPATPERFVRFAAAALVAFVALGKVLSPQFLVWLVPVVPLVAGRRGLWASGLLAAALVLTQTWFPFRYWGYVRAFDQGVAWTVLARDLVLLALLAVLVWAGRDREEAGHGRA